MECFGLVACVLIVLVVFAAFVGKQPVEADQQTPPDEQSEEAKHYVESVVFGRGWHPTKARTGTKRSRHVPLGLQRFKSPDFIVKGHF